MQEEKLKINIIGDASQLNKALTTASGRLQTFGNKVSGIGKKLSIGLSLPLGIAGGAAIKMASDFEESQNKVAVAFRESVGVVRDFAKTTLTQFGIAQGTALDMAALFGDMATSMGLSTGQAANMSTALVGLAGDLASFKNMNIEEVTTALNGVFTGETESLKRLGVVMTEVNLQQFAQDQGIRKTLKSMTQAEKVNLRFQYVMAKTANAHGDFSRTSGGAANQMRIFQESLKELGVSFGQILLPAFTKLVNYGNNLLKMFSGLSPQTKQLAVAFAAVAAALPIIITIAGSLISVFGALISPVGAIIAGLSAIAYVVYSQWGTIKTYLVDIANYFIDLYNESMGFRLVVEGIAAYFKILYRVGKASLTALWNIVKGVLNNFVEGFKNLGDIIAGVFTLDPDQIMKGVEGMVNTTFDNISLIAEEGSKLISEAFEIIADEGTKAYEKAYKANPISHITEEDLDNMVNSVGDFVSGIKDKFLPIGAAVEETITEPLQEAFNPDNVEWINTLYDNVDLDKIIQDAKNFTEQAKLATQQTEYWAGTVGGILMDSFTALMTGGDFFKTLIDGLKQLVIKLIAAAAAAALLNALLPAIFPGAGGMAAGGAGGFKTLFSSLSGMPMAKGGIVSSPTLALIGEYGGAKSNPEVVAPLDKLQSMMGDRGSQNVTVGGEFRIQGQDLVVALQRAERNRSRII